MTMQTAIIRARVDAQAKENAERILQRFGLSLNDALRIFLARINAENGLPFAMREATPITPSLNDLMDIDPIESEKDWQALSINAFTKDWNNPDDEIYDNWREFYGKSR